MVGNNSRLQLAMRVGSATFLELLTCNNLLSLLVLSKDVAVGVRSQTEDREKAKVIT
jgi:hypothetical protein